MQCTNPASAECYLRWHAAHALHTDRQFFGKIDFRRDILPGEPGGRLLSEPLYAVWGVRNA